MPRLTQTLLVVGLSLSLSVPAWAKKKPEPMLTAAATTTQTTQATSSGDEPWLKFTLTTEERQRLVTYYQAQPVKQKALPPGLAKKVARGGSLPPGWQKKVARGEVLGYDVYQASERVPTVVIKELPPQPPGTVLIRVEGKIVRLWEATRTIIDVLDL